MKPSFIISNTLLILLLTGNTVFASVTDSSYNGFTIKYDLVIKMSSDNLYNTFTDIAKWWDSEHTYSGKAANLSLQPFAGGCFCEKLENGGSVHHMSVLFVIPGQIIRMEGGLGPLQALAVNGIMTTAFTKNPEGTKLSVTYTVGGYTPGGLLKMASAVDRVLGEQLNRLKEVAERTGK